jgi:hypothetical protein
MLTCNFYEICMVWKLRKDEMKEIKMNVGLHKSWAPGCMDEWILYNGTKYFQHNYCSPPSLPFPYVQKCKYRNASSRMCQITMKFTGHSRIVGFGTFFVSAFWYQNLEVVSGCLGNLWTPVLLSCGMWWCTLMMEAWGSCETSVQFCHTAWHYISERQ